RLWPLSTRRRAKQFLRLGSERPLLALTAERALGTVERERLWVVCGEDQVGTVAAQLPQVPAGQILAEPSPRNTLPAVALAAAAIAARDPQATVAILPSDHWIPPEDWELFSKDLRLAARVSVREQGLVALGIRPRTPQTGYGYLQAGNERSLDGEGYYAVKQFHEKPALRQAEEYLRRGDFFWNAGIFIWSLPVFFEEFRRHRPAMAAAFEPLTMPPGPSGDAAKLRKAFAAAENLSVDVGLMEKSSRVFLVPARFRWDDVGSYSSLKNILPKDPRGNHIQGDVVCRDAKNNLAVAASRRVALLGVEGLVVIETPDAVLVMSEGRAQEVKQLVETFTEGTKAKP
ncbi:MAG: mannose-1-phosphate guanylyltransferase, partial [Candidatus Binatia bacterium]